MDIRIRRAAFAMPALALASLLALAPAAGAPQHDRVLAELAPGARAALHELATFEPEELARLGAAADPAALAHETHALLALGSLNLATRAVDAEGRTALHRHLRARLEALAPHGLEIVGSLRGRVPAPVPLDRRLDPAAREPPAALEVGGERFPLHTLWANGPLPSLAPRAGLAGPLLDTGDAGWEQLKGLPLPGAIALMDFRGGRNWERLFSLGVQAVIVVEDDYVARDTAERLFAHTPIPCPRYYVDRETGARLRALAGRHTGPRAVVTGGTLYEDRPWETVFAYLPPSTPSVHVVAPGELLARIAADHGLTGSQLAEAAGLADARVELAPGTRLALPGNRAGHEVRSGELWARLAQRYGLAPETLRAANPGLPDHPSAGTQIVVPAVEDTLVVVVPIDAMSVVPDAPHGALRAANLAAFLRFLEHLARESGAPRRKGLLAVFQDADTLGGVSSRTLALYAALAQGRYTPLARTETHDHLARLEGALAWFSASGQVAADSALQALPPAHLAWLARDWLPARLEERRIQLAEARIAAAAARAGLAPDAPDAERRQLEDEAAQADEALQRLVALRNRTLGPGRNAGAAELARFRRALAEGAAPGSGLAWDDLLRRLRQERDDEAFLRDTHTHNLDAVRRVLARLHPGPAAPRLGWFLDLTDGSATLGLNHGRAGEFRGGAPAAADPGTPRTFERRFAQLVAAAAVRAGWTEEWLFAAEADRREFPLLPVATPATYPDFWTAADVALLSLGTLNDRLQRVDTPHDVPERIRFDRLGLVARSAFALLQAGLERPADSLAPPRLTRARLGGLSGRALQFNLRSGIDAQDPVAGAAVYLPAVKQVEIVNAHNTSTHRGYRRGVMTLTSVDGTFRLPPESTGFPGLNRIHAYRLDRETALFDKIVNHGQVGTRAQELEFSLQADREAARNLVMVDVYPLAIFAATDPYMHQPIGGERERKLRQSFRLIDSVLHGEPPRHAVENPALHFNERDLATTLLYAPPGRSLRAVVQEKSLFKLLLTGPLDARGVGRGYPVGPRPAAAGAAAPPGADRNLSLPLTALATARDFLAMSRHRLDLLRSHGITTRSLEESVERIDAKVRAADAAVAARDWEGATGAAREAWGMAIKTYPRILGLGREAVFSVIVLMALLVPACVFLERLLLGARGLVRRLVGVACLFAAGTIFLNAHHPAFQIAVSPFIVVIAFTMILMSVLVLVLCYRRFEALLRRLREQEGETTTDPGGPLASLRPALALGVANLRKRPLRSSLTTFSVGALTFAIVAFVSVTGRDALRFRANALDPDIEGRLVEPEPPAYEGVLFRKFNWYDYGTQEIATLRSEFSAAHEVTARGFYLEVEGGAAADREGVNQIPVAHGDRRAVQTGVMTFEPNEPRFSGLHRAVSAEAWFRPEDRFHAFIPDTLAAALGIEAAALVDETGRRRPDAELPALRFLDLEWRVIGVLDTERADRIRDVNGKSLALVDHRRSAMTRNATGESLLNETPSVHLGWSRLLIVPGRAAEDINAKPRALAVRLGEDTDTARFLDDLALRLNQAFFVHAEGRLGILSPTERTSVAGLARIIVPVLLCGLIVFNTMMGSVEERRGEVGMLGAIGLSPRQISFLLVSESLVHAVLGIVAGLFAGLAFANLVPRLDALGLPLFAGLSFNFASLASVVLALATGGVVLLATLVPARRAAALATPSGMDAWELPPPCSDGRIVFTLPFTLTHDNSAGMTAFFRRFLGRHSEPTSADFNCRQVRIASDARGGTTIACTLWLAPYDLDVAQEFSLRVEPSATPGLDRVVLLLERRSGTEEAWLRTTYAFLNLVRRQFLLWRNLSPHLRARFVAEGRALLGSSST